jgi:hypothetical protein
MAHVPTCKPARKIVYHTSQHWLPHIPNQSFVVSTIAQPFAKETHNQVI